MKREDKHIKTIKHLTRRSLRAWVEELDLNELDIPTISHITGGNNLFIGFFNNTVGQLGHTFAGTLGHIKGGIGRYWDNLTSYQKNSIFGLGIFVVAAIATRGAIAKYSKENSGSLAPNYNLTLEETRKGYFINANDGMLYRQDAENPSMIYRTEKDPKHPLGMKETPIHTKSIVSVKTPSGGAIDAREIDVRNIDLKTKNSSEKKQAGWFIDAETKVMYRQAIELSFANKHPDSANEPFFQKLYVFYDAHGKKLTPQESSKLQITNPKSGVRHFANTIDVCEYTANEPRKFNHDVVSIQGKSAGVFFGLDGKYYVQGAHDHRIIYDASVNLVNKPIAMTNPLNGEHIADARTINVRSLYAAELQQEAAETQGAFIDAQTGALFYKKPAKGILGNPLTNTFEIYNESHHRLTQAETHSLQFQGADGKLYLAKSADLSLINAKSDKFDTDSKNLEKVAFLGADRKLYYQDPINQDMIYDEHHSLVQHKVDVVNPITGKVMVDFKGNALDARKFDLHSFYGNRIPTESASKTGFIATNGEYVYQVPVPSQAGKFELFYPNGERILGKKSAQILFQDANGKFYFANSADVSGVNAKSGALNAERKDFGKVAFLSSDKKLYYQDPIDDRIYDEDHNLIQRPVGVVNPATGEVIVDLAGHTIDARKFDMLHIYSDHAPLEAASEKGFMATTGKFYYQMPANGRQGEFQIYYPNGYKVSDRESNDIKFLGTDGKTYLARFSAVDLPDAASEPLTAAKSANKRFLTNHKDASPQQIGPSAPPKGPVYIDLSDANDYAEGEFDYKTTLEANREKFEKGAKGGGLIRFVFSNFKKLLLK